MKLFVCWGKFGIPWPRKEKSWRPGDHACKLAYDALVEAGHAPEVQRVYGLHGHFATRGRKEVKRLSGQDNVPVLVRDDGEVVVGSDSIVAWARAGQGAAAAPQQRA